MKNKNKLLMTILLIIVIFLSGCNQAKELERDNQMEMEEVLSSMNLLKEENKNLLMINKELERQLKTQLDGPSELDPTKAQDLINTGYRVMNLVKNKDMQGLSTYVHPVQGLRFTPLVHINTTFDQKFTGQEVARLDQDSTVYDWGYYYGGPPETSIMMDFNEYYDEFIYKGIVCLLPGLRWSPP